MRLSGSGPWNRVGVAAVLMLVTGLVVAVAPSSPAAAQGSLIHVDEAASGSNDGSSWADAFTDVQDALAVATAGDEIRVAEGTYTPHASDRTVSFGLVDGVTMTGGYATGGTAGPDPDLYETVLSGDLAGDDLPGFVNNGENSHHVVTADASVTSAAVLDGFVVSGGNADGQPAGDVGGGIYVADGSPSLSQMTVTGNRGRGVFTRRSSLSIVDSAIVDNVATGLGGGLYFDASPATLARSTVSGNSAGTRGGGIFARGTGASGAPSIATTEISDNVAGTDGGGIATFSTQVDVTNSMITGNTATGAGGGVHAVDEWTVLVDTLIADNQAGTTGGGVATSGMVGWIPSPVLLSNSTVTGNTAGTDAGGVSSEYPFFINSIVWGNSPASMPLASAVVDYSDVEGWSGGGVGNIDADPLFAGGGDYRLRAGSPAIHAGDDTAVLVDVFDVDGDGDTVELTPDLDLSERVQGPAVDMGAYETRVLSPGGFGNGEGQSGSQVFEIPISLSAPSAETITVDYVSWPCTAWGGCGDGLATEGVDYESPAPGTLTFAPGETTKTVPVTVYGDTDVEPRILWGEWFFIAFSNETNAVLDRSFFGLGAGIIGDDDP